MRTPQCAIRRHGRRVLPDSADSGVPAFDRVVSCGVRDGVLSWVYAPGNLKLVQVVAVDGKKWDVHRKWVSRHKSLFSRWRRSKSDRETDPVSFIDDVSSHADDGLLLGILFGVAIAVGTALAVFFGGFVVLILLGLVDLFLLAALLIAGVAASTFLGRPWVIEAVTEDGTLRHVFKVKGWRRSGRAKDAIAESLHFGSTPTLGGKPATEVETVSVSAA